MVITGHFIDLPRPVAALALLVLIGCVPLVLFAAPAASFVIAGVLAVSSGTLALLVARPELGSGTSRSRADLDLRVRGIGVVEYRRGMRLLVVDDEAELAEAVARGLRREGYAVDVALDGEDALDKVRLVPYDLICLDLTMPGIDGLEVCRRLREDPPLGENPRVLMLTARDTLEDRVAGLDEGADDYLVKPFAFPELSARIRTLLRRDAGASGAVVEIGEISLDTGRREVFRGTEEVALTAKEFALLRYFMSHPGTVISQEELLDHVWDENADPFTNTVRVTVGTLRRKLSKGDDSPIETVIGQGYKLRDEP